jgi:uncharacterized secreted protein with C-terminal beta-propeller domain
VAGGLGYLDATEWRRDASNLHVSPAGHQEAAMHRRTALVGALAATVVALGAVQLAPGAAPTARAAGLTSYSSCDELLAAYRSELERSATTGILGWPERMVFSATTPGVPAADGLAARDSAATGAVGSGPTGTNLQEQGVDEPDLAKLRDGRLVVLAGRRLKVVSAEAQPRLLGSLTMPGHQAYGGELLLVGDRAVVVVPGWRQDPQAGPSGEGGEPRMLMPIRPGVPTTEVVLVDLTGDQPRLLERSTYDGQYVSARLVGGTLRLVTTTRPQPVVVYPTEAGPVAERLARTANAQAAASVGLLDVLPQVVRRDADGTVLEHGAAVACDQTFHTPYPSGASTLLVTTIRPGDGLAATDRTAVTTDGDLVYAAEDRLYVATSRWGTVAPMVALDDTRGAVDRSLPAEVRTQVHAFDTTSDTETEYVGSGAVPGYVLGRWALSRFDGDLRVATTRQPPWDAAAPDGSPGTVAESSSMVVRLAERDGALVETGRVAGLGKGEQIQAVRYFGDIAAVVTFRQTDPLYLLDLSGDPQVRGELKVPGFSTYLHPLGDGLLLGLGQDATNTGQVTGMQVSVFDISDLSHPVLRDRLRLGEGWSTASDDSRAFGYDPGKRLATFPFTSYDPSGAGRERPGAVGVSVAEDGALSLAGRLDTAGGSWPQRVLSDGERVYAVTDNAVVAGDASTMARTGELTFGG